MRRLTFAILITLTLLTGCTSRSQHFVPNPSPLPPRGQAYVNIIADWNHLEGGGFRPASTGHDVPPITHVGTRLIYPDANATFSQAVERDDAAFEGVITLSVPPSDNVNLQVVTVHYNGTWNAGADGNRVLGMAVLKGIQIRDQEVLELRLSDLDWIEATWWAEESVQQQLWNRVIYIEDETDVFKPSIWVTDPFQYDGGTSYADRLIRLSGNSIPRENIDGNRRIEVWCQKNESSCSMQPYLDASKFNLPTDGSVYAIVNPALPGGRVKVIWTQNGSE